MKTTITTPESEIVEKIRQALLKRDCYVVKHHGSGYGIAGTPDLLICAPGGRFVGLEVKRPEHRARVSAAQTLRLKQILNAGGVAAVVTSVDEALSAVFPASEAGARK